MFSPDGSELDLLTDTNSFLVLVDYQPAMIKSIASGDRLSLKAVVFAAKSASILGVPVVMSSINPKNNGNVYPKLQNYFQIMKYLQGKFRVLMHLKIKQLMMLLKKLIKIK